MPQVVIAHMASLEDGARDMQAFIPTSLEVLEIWYAALLPQAESLADMEAEIDAKGKRVYAQRNVRSACPPPQDD